MLELKDFTRWQLDVPLLLGKHGDWYRWWAGPRLLVTFYGTELEFGQPSIPGVTSDREVVASLDGAATYLGGQLGGAIGYKYVFFGFELTCARFWTKRQAEGVGRRARPRARELDRSSRLRAARRILNG